VSAGLSGNLSDFSIADVFQLIGHQRKTGVLELKSGSTRAQLVFDRGLVVSASVARGRSGDFDPLVERLVRGGQVTRERADEAAAVARSSAQSVARTLVARGWLDASAVSRALDLVTSDAIFDVLRWHGGTFDFHAKSVEHDRDPTELLAAEQILMDGLRMVDEWQSIEKLVPSESTVFERTRESDLRTGDAARVLALIDGRLSVRRVIDLAQVGTFDGMRILSELRSSGAIRPAEVAVAQALVERARSVGSAWLAIARFAVALIPLAALSVVVWRTTGPAPRVSAGDHRIERESLASLREDYAVRATRHAIEAYRLSRGHWPERLDELTAAGLLPAETLATLEGRAYYSLNGDQGPIFLAPERS
jgi:Domain of unknown function (DUF4388)